jgi:hypothetical protein
MAKRAREQAVKERAERKRAKRAAAAAARAARAGDGGDDISSEIAASEPAPPWQT